MMVNVTAGICPNTGTDPIILFHDNYKQVVYLLIFFVVITLGILTKLCKKKKLPLHEPAENIFDHVVNGFDSLAIGPTAVRNHYGCSSWLRGEFENSKVFHKRLNLIDFSKNKNDSPLLWPPKLSLPNNQMAPFPGIFPAKPTHSLNRPLYNEQYMSENYLADDDNSMEWEDEGGSTAPSSHCTSVLHHQPAAITVTTNRHCKPVYSCRCLILTFVILPIVVCFVSFFIIGIM
jgi:hypothetical protein